MNKLNLFPAILEIVFIFGGKLVGNWWNMSLMGGTSDSWGGDG